MSKTLPAGPYRQVTLGGGPTVPWYIIPFDKHGVCTGPKTKDHLIRAAGGEHCSDIFIFSHGWNNDWEAASERYENFIGGVIRTRESLGVPHPDGYSPVLVGVFWPSTALVLPWEKGPKFASVGAESPDNGVGEYQNQIAEVAEFLPEADRERFYRLAQAEALDDEQGLEFVTLLGTAAAHFDAAYQDLGETGDKGNGSEPTPQERLDAWRKISSDARQPQSPGEFGYVTDDIESPQAAFSPGALDPRSAIRALTVLQMKDRAARVGALGVGPLLRELRLAAPTARVHLVGHSYGCIVILSALCSLPSAEGAPEVESVFLLQPAVSQWCFAPNVAGRGYPGGYREALRRVRSPIFTTFSISDAPLRHFFHLAARRDRDLGQPQIAGGDLPHSPSRYAALGGYGPAGLSEDECQVLAINAPPDVYCIRTDPTPRVCAINGDRGIGGHGDISNPMTWWTMLTLIERGPFGA
jgi:hypothetical protein